jgi:hypothetical protein
LLVLQLLHLGGVLFLSLLDKLHLLLGLSRVSVLYYKAAYYHVWQPFGQ